MVKALASLFVFVLVIGAIGVAIVATQQKTNTQSQAGYSGNVSLTGKIIPFRFTPSGQPAYQFEATNGTKYWVYPTTYDRVIPFANQTVKVTGQVISGTGANAPVLMSAGPRLDLLLVETITRP